MPKDKFNKPANLVAFNLKRAAAEARAMFPDETQGIIFCDAQSMQAVDPFELRASPKFYFSVLQESMRIARELKTSLCAKIHNDLYFILLYTEKDMANYTGGNLSTQRFYAFDHELAHVIIPVAQPPGIVSEHFAECVADSFAAIRHFQRFGVNSNALDQCGVIRATNALFGDNEFGSMQHFTSPVVDKIITMKDSLYLDRLNPQQTAELAVHMAQSFALAPKTLEMWHKACIQTTAAMADGMNSDALHDSAQHILDIQHPLLAKWGYAVLEGVLDGSIKTFLNAGHHPQPMPQLTGSPRENIVQRLIQCKDSYGTLCKDAPVFTAMKN